jgi:predicted enzyme related to lactoylglutathione lyase
MPERDGNIPASPAGVEASEPDPEAAVDFYGGVFGWDLTICLPHELVVRWRT